MYMHIKGKGKGKGVQATVSQYGDELPVNKKGKLDKALVSPNDKRIS